MKEKKSRVPIWPLILVLMAPGWRAGAGPGGGDPTGEAEPYWRTGHQLILELGVGGDTTNLSSAPNYGRGGRLTFDTDIHAAAGIFYAYRFLPYLAAGAGLHYTMMDAEVSGAKEVDGRAFALDVHAGILGYPPLRGRLDPYLGVLVGYALWSFPLKDTRDDYWQYTLQGVSLQLTAGMDIYINQYFSVGPVFRYFFSFWMDYCGSGPTERCQDVDEITANTIYGEDFAQARPDVFFVGLQGVFHIR